jgi:hypothetical protein
MQQDDESETPPQAEQRNYRDYYLELQSARRWNSLLAQLRKLAWFAWGAWIALSVDTLARDGTAPWLLLPFAGVWLYTALVDSVLKLRSEEEVAKWLRMVYLDGSDSRGDIENILIPFIEAERLVKEGWLRRKREDWYKLLDCDWDVLLGGHARGWRRTESLEYYRYNWVP